MHTRLNRRQPGAGREEQHGPRGRCGELRGSGSRLPSLNPAGCSERQPLPAAGRAGPQAPGSRGARRPLATARAKTVAAEAGEMRCPGHRARRTWTRRCAGSHWECTSSRACRARRDGHAPHPPRGLATAPLAGGGEHRSPWNCLMSHVLTPRPSHRARGDCVPFSSAVASASTMAVTARCPQATADTFGGVSASGDPELQSSHRTFRYQEGGNFQEHRPKGQRRPPVPEVTTPCGGGEPGFTSWLGPTWVWSESLQPANRQLFESGAGSPRVILRL